MQKVLLKLRLSVLWTAFDAISALCKVRSSEQSPIKGSSSGRGTYFGGIVIPMVACAGTCHKRR
eukprot:3475807-Amphidinium_carterae.1